MTYKKTLVLLAIMLYAPHAHTIFDTLELITAYAQAIPENTQPSNDDLLKPDFTDLLKRQQPSFFANIINNSMHFFNIAPDPLWDIDHCIALMKKVTKERVELGNTKKHVVRLPNSTQMQCVIWGDIQGAFHSLVRDLNYLFKQGYLNSHLKIIKPNTYFIFNGDAINRSPYSLATLTVLMKLIEQNPQHAFYVQGNHETKTVWPNYTLSTELYLRSKTASHQPIPFASELNAFFNTLPLAVYIPNQHTDHSFAFIRISHYNRIEMPTLNSVYFGEFLRKESERLGIFYLKDNSKTRDYVDICAIIQAQSRSTIYQKLDGLKLIASDLGATTWTQLSCPTPVYQKLYHFYYDAFTVLDTREYIDQATITLHNQDIRSMKGFKTTTFNLLTGGLQSANPPPLLPRINQNNSTPDKGNEIVIGSITDFSNSSAITGPLLREGMSVKCNQMNSEYGGVHSKRLRLVMLDDRYTPNLTFAQAQILLNDYKTNILLTPQGTSTLEACLPLIKAHKILALFNWGGAQIFRDPKLIDCINYRTSYYNEAKALIDYAVNKLYIKNFTFFYQDDSYGLSLIEAARQTLKHLGITQWTEIPYQRNAVDLEASLVKKIKDSSPEAIVFFSTITQSAVLIRAIGIPYLVNKYLFAITFLSDEFRYFLTEKGLPLIISRVVPNPYTSNLKITQEYRTHMQQYAPDSSMSVDSFEAYINTCLLIDVMEKMTGEITKDKIIKAFEQMKNYEFKGLILNFDPKTRELATNTIVWIDNGDEWLEKIKRPITQLPTEHPAPAQVKP